VFDRLTDDLKVRERDLAQSALADDRATRLMTIPGINMVVALALIAAIGDIKRFAKPEQLVGYLGLNPSVRQSGPGPAYHGRITKQDRGHARGMLVEAGWVARAAWAKRIPARREPSAAGLMGWMAPERDRMCQGWSKQLQQRGPSMTQVTTIGLDLGKRVFQVHGVDAGGAVVLRRQLKRRQMVPFFTKVPSCLIGLEACGTAHYWGRMLRGLGQEVRLIPPAYAKAYARPIKTAPADAEAICEAVRRPSMRFVPITSEPDQAMAAVHRVRERLIAQRIQTTDMLRGQMAEFGPVAAKGPQHVKGLVAELVEAASVPEPLRQALLGLVQLLTVLREENRGAG
jgi:transposase